jgi:endonuclease YncB( thermonuclease family)
MPFAALSSALTMTIALSGAFMWIDVAVAKGATLHVSPSGSDGGSCAASAPCRTFDRAYRAASPGDVVEVAGGSYGNETIPALGRSGPAIELRSAPGASVRLAGLGVRADHVVVRGMAVADWLSVDSKNASDPVEHVTLVDMHTSKHWINNARDFLWRGGSIGPAFNEKASMIGGQPASRRLTYDGILWHDATRDSNVVHMECFYVASVQGLTVRNSRFSNCAVFNVLITRMPTDDDPRDIVFENNVFERSRDVGAASAYYAMGIHAAVTLNSLVLRNNVWAQPISIGTTVQSGRAVGNIGVGGWDGGCQKGLAYSHNVFTTKACGPHDRVDAQAFSQFVDPAGGDWRLKSGATAIGAAHPDDHPATDAAGHARDRAPDAGAFEHGTGGAAGGGGATGTVPAPGATRPGARKQRVRVLRVLDGRTLRVRLEGGRRIAVRLLGIRPPRCGRRLAGARLRGLAPAGHSVALISDPAVSPRDRRGRRRAYVTRSRRDLGALLVRSGWARLAPGSKQLARHGRYASAQRRAAQRNLGAWGRC